MKKLKKLCGAVLIAGFMLPQIALGSTDKAEAVSGKWKQDGKKWWYSYSDGTYPKSKWENINGKWYHFDKWGYMQTGWQKISGKWYYFGTNGIMKTGWQKIGKKWYYFASGVMKTGWLKSGGKWYYFDGSGAMVTGTKTIGGKSYTFGSDGVMKEGSSTTSSYANAKVGDIIKFGHYEQDDKSSNGKEPIEWQVLDRKEDGSLLVISKYGLDTEYYNPKHDGEMTWETSLIRKWLNSTFLNEAFSSTEQNIIVTTTVKNDLLFRESGGRNTKDKIFLLSYEEVIQYYKLHVDDRDADYGHSSYSGDSCCCKPTTYADEKGVGVVAYFPTLPSSIDPKYEGNCSWWLRTSPYPGAFSCVYYDGYVQPAPDPIRLELLDYAIRPAMVIKP